MPRLPGATRGRAPLRRGEARPAASCRLVLGGSEAALEMHQQQGDCRRRDTRDAGGLTDGTWAMAVELLLDFGRKPLHLSVVEVRGQLARLHCGVALDLCALALDVALVLRLDFDLLDDRR